MGIRNINDGLNYMYNALNYVCGIYTDYDKRFSSNVDICNAYEQFLPVKKDIRRMLFNLSCTLCY